MGVRTSRGAHKNHFLITSIQMHRIFDDMQTFLFMFSKIFKRFYLIFTVQYVWGLVGTFLKMHWKNKTEVKSVIQKAVAPKIEVNPISHGEGWPQRPPLSFIAIAQEPWYLGLSNFLTFRKTKLSKCYKKNLLNFYYLPPPPLQAP